MGDEENAMPIMDTGSDVALDYPSECFKESCYIKCPWCRVSVPDGLEKQLLS